MSKAPWTTAGLALLLTALVLPAAQPERGRNEAQIKEAELRELKARVDRAQRQAQKDAADETRLSRALRDAERAVSRASGSLSVLRAQRAERREARQQLVEERERREAEREATTADLARQMRAAYFMGRNEPLKLLLNQRSPAEFGRNLTYYGYLGRLRATQIAAIAKNIAQIEELTDKIDEEDGKLADLEEQQKQQLDEREAAVKQRGKVLASMREEGKDRAAALKRMQTQQRQLENLIKELNRAAQAVPFDPNSTFSRGKLSWPVAGRIATNYGKRLGLDLVSDGIDIDAARGAEVRAVHGGVVIFSDYWSGRGNMIIVDHRNGYLSVYGHAENLFKASGTTVATGEKIATVGDSGGRPRPGLYFELRRNGKPVDPRGLFRSAAPPGG